ncbi:sensor histidine kinase [Ectobacillus sp. sgz5001026]|uniref:sensor histidine kinase n=1 Tax=Ectobacillus sp. sgz5001026 TaxID=3242473 RepID=UPI0036D39B55
MKPHKRTIRFFHKLLANHLLVLLLCFLSLFLATKWFIPSFLYDLKSKELIRVGTFLVKNPASISEQMAPPSDTSYHVKRITESTEYPGGFQLTKENWDSLNSNTVLTFKHIRLHQQDSVTIVILPIKNHEALMLVSPITDTEEAINKVESVLWMIGGIALLVSILLSIFLSKHIEQRLMQMQHLTRQIANGNYSNRLPVQGHDELADLSMDLNKMAATLEETEREIKRMMNVQSQFLADVSHELKTPLTTMRGFLEILRTKECSDEEEQRTLFLLEQETIRLIRLVLSVMDLERLRSGETHLHLHVHALKPVLSAVTEQMSILAEEKELELILVPFDDVALEMEEDRFRQIFINLIRNAIQFTNEGTITIQITQHTKDVAISVQDTGIGFDVDQQQDIFERFYKIEPSRQKTEGEMGLGLALVKQLVLAHHGHIEVTSEVGKGSTFTVILPLSTTQIG